MYCSWGVQLPKPSSQQHLREAVKALQVLHRAHKSVYGLQNGVLRLIEEHDGALKSKSAVKVTHHAFASNMEAQVYLVLPSCHPS